MSTVDSTHLDPVEVAVDHYRLLHAGERARVVQMNLPPGARDQQHSHPTEFVYFIQGSTARIHLPGADPVELEISDDMLMEHEPWTHSVENIGSREIVAIIFELTD